MAALPYLVMFIMVQIGGQLADLIRKRDLLSTTNTRRFFTAGGNTPFGINSIFVQIMLRMISLKLR